MERSSQLVTDIHEQEKAAWLAFLNDPIPQLGYPAYRVPLDIRPTLKKIWMQDNSIFLVSLFDLVLNREPDLAFINAGLAELEQGLPRQLILYRLLQSKEAEDIHINLHCAFDAEEYEEERILQLSNPEDVPIHYFYQSLTARIPSKVFCKCLSLLNKFLGKKRSRMLLIRLYRSMDRQG